MGKKQKLLKAVASGKSLAQACRDVNIGRTTLGRWRKNEAYEAALMAAKAESVVTTNAKRKAPPVTTNEEHRKNLPEMKN